MEGWRFQLENKGKICFLTFETLKVLIEDRDEITELLNEKNYNNQIEQYKFYCLNLINY
jgi:hypothetical protein